MTISFNGVKMAAAEGVQPAEQKTVSTQVKKENVPETKPDEVDLSTKKEKTSVWQKFKNGYTSVKKFFIGINEYAKGTIKGLLYGGTASLAILGADALKGVVTKAEKPLSTKGKIAAGVAGAAIMGINLFRANLNANKKNADVDHRWRTGHNA